MQKIIVVLCLQVWPIGYPYDGVTAIYFQILDINKLACMVAMSVTKAKCYKTFNICNLQILILSSSVRP
jgi:hypothetical protein